MVALGDAEDARVVDRRRRFGNADNLDALDFEMTPGCVLAQLGGLAGQVAWYSEHYVQLGWKHWPSVLAWNISIGAVMARAQDVEKKT